MIVLYLFIIVFFVIWGQKDFKQSFLTYAPISIFINAGMALRYAPPSIGVALVLNLYYGLTYYYRFRCKLNVSEKFPLKSSFGFMLASYAISAIITFVEGSISGFTNAINTIFSVFIFTYLFWNICQTKNDIKYFIKVLGCFFGFAFIYGLYENATMSNPILDAIFSGIPEDYSEGKLAMSNADNLREGRFRVQSLFHISILYGIYSVLFMFFMLFVNKQKYIVKTNKWILAVVIVLSLYACYTSNSKTPLVAIPIFFIPYVLHNKGLLAITVIVAFVFLFNPDSILQPLGKIINLEAFDKSNDDMSGGSNLYMRIIQLNASLEYWKQAPLFGNGLRTSALFAEKDPRLFGCESVWFKTMIERGGLGLIAYIGMIIENIKVAVKYDKKFFIAMYAIGFFVICSITDINYTLYFMCYIAMLKICTLENLEFQNKNPY